MRQLETGSDSGFSKEAEKGYAIRGANHCRLGKTADGNIVRHLFDSVCRSQRRVTRSTFSSELCAAVDATDEMLSHALCLHEIAVALAAVMKRYELLNQANSASKLPL